MIKYNIEDRKTANVIEARYAIPRKELQRIRVLLDIKSFEEMDDAKREKLGIKPDSSEYIFGIEFEDGAKLDWKLCCGDNNYFDDVLFQYPSGAWEDLDCTYDLDDIEIDTGSTIYIVRLVVIDG